MDRLERQLVNLPLLQDPSSYIPDTVELTEDAMAREYWLYCFEEALDGVGLENISQNSVFHLNNKRGLYSIGRKKKIRWWLWPLLKCCCLSLWAGGKAGGGQPARRAGSRRASREVPSEIQAQAPDAPPSAFVWTLHFFFNVSFVLHAAPSFSPALSRWK